MAEKVKSKTFKIIPPPPGMEFVGPGQQIHLRLNVGPLKEIFVYYDPLDDGGPEHKRGYVRFYPTSEHRPIAQLVYSWFPPGTWKVKFSEPAHSGAVYATSIEPGWTNADEKVVGVFKERLKSLDLAIGWEFTKLPKSKKNIAMQKAEVTEAVRSAAEKGREVLLKVAYDRSDGDIRSLLTSEPVHGDASYLLDEPLARIFLEFVEHFGNIEVDHGLARGGLTDEKLKKVREPNPTVVDAITNLFTQGYGEFEWSRRSAQPTPSIEDFKQMEEAIFFQARVRNDLARRNLLRIGIGFLQDKSGKREDIGVVRRPCVSGLACEGAPRWLLYDRRGVAVTRAGGAFRDLEYRSVDLEKLKREAVFPVPVPVAPGLLVVRGVPIVEIDIRNRDIYGFLRALEQGLGGPPRELIALAASLFNYGLFIARELHEQNKAWVLAGRTIEFAAHILADHRTADGRAPLSKDAEKALLKHPWPGNVRELLHTLHRAFFKSNGARIEVAHLSFDEPKRVSLPTSPPPGMTEAAPASPPSPSALRAPAAASHPAAPSQPAAAPPPAAPPAPSAPPAATMLMPPVTLAPPTASAASMGPLAGLPFLPISPEIAPTALIALVQTVVAAQLGPAASPAARPAPTLGPTVVSPPIPSVEPRSVTAAPGDDPHVKDVARVFIIGKHLEAIVDEVLMKTCTRLRHPQEVAAALGVGRATVYRRLEALGYLPSDFSRTRRPSEE